MFRHVRYLFSSDWVARNGARIAGLAFGTLGTVVITMFVVVVLTGEGYNDLSDDAAPTVYPDF